MHQLKIIIKFNTSAVKQEINSNEIINSKQEVDAEEINNTIKNGKFSNLNNLSKKRKQ